jgi:hypothetical protein
VPSWTLPTLTYHEGIPGHHLQGTLALEAGLPEIRKVQFFSGYGEGWALYAEELAVEMGAYADDPLGHVGQLHDAMFRAVRLVVDSGMHAMGWSREKAIAFFTDTIGDPETVATTEVERYCIWPGQACSYMLGKIDWLRLREKAKAQLGPRFDIRKFHDAGLLPGAMPLTVLDQCIEAYIAEEKGALRRPGPESRVHMTAGPQASVLALWARYRAGPGPAPSPARRIFLRQSRRGRRLPCPCALGPQTCHILGAGRISARGRACPDRASC